MGMINLYNRNGVMRVAALVSKRGTLLRKVVESAKNYSVVAIFADSADSEAVGIGKEFNIPVIVNDINDFYAGRSKGDMAVRQEFDKETAKSLSHFKPDILAFAGYMHIATAPLLNSFLCVNFHPADLTILNSDGTRKYAGKDAVKRSILAGEQSIRSSIIIAEPVLDAGKILVVSKPLKIATKSALEVEKMLEERDTLPKALSLIAQGRFAVDKGILYFDNKPTSGVDEDGS